MNERDEFYLQRLEKTNNLRELGLNPYDNSFRVDTRVADFVRLYTHIESSEELAEIDTVHHVAGRVMAVNSFGKAAFLRIQDATSDEKRDEKLDGNDESVGRLQIFIKKDRVGEDVFKIFKKLDLGDFIGVTGTAMRTKTGELTVAASSFQILTKTLRPLPEKWHGLSDVETRYRQRYLDLVSNEDVRQVFRKRSKIVAWIRNYLIQKDFLEVETPMMQVIAGGAAAKPFVTHHNALDLDLYLRIAPELYLKRLVVGGFDRVFEINRNFRNEGVSSFHNPEFTMLEFYQAYANYLDLMEIGEELISGAAEAVNGTTDVVWGEHNISLARPFKRLTMLEAIAEYGGPAQEVSRDLEGAAAELKKVGIDADGMNSGQRVVALFEHYAEHKLIQPTFIYDYPADVSPLARKRDSDPYFVDRFELFAGGHELGNAFSELNDPIDQNERFEAQIAAKNAGDDEAHAMDEDYIRALEHGMPPAGGFGLGIDRLVMMLTGMTSIREVILFPLLRPEE